MIGSGTMSRSRIALLVAAAAAGCFRDERPDLGGAAASTGDGSTTTAASGGTSTAGATTTAAATTGVTGSGGVTGTSASTSATTSTSTDAGTATDGTTDVGTSTGGLCGPEDGIYACWLCCEEAMPGPEVYLAAVRPCVCVPSSPCSEACAGDLCMDMGPSEACYSCLQTQGEDPCVMAAVNACGEDPACTQFVVCMIASGCVRL